MRPVQYNRMSIIIDEHTIVYELPAQSVKHYAAAL